MKTYSLRSIILCVLLELFSASVVVASTERISVASDGEQRSSNYSMRKCWMKEVITIENGKKLADIGAVSTDE